MHIIHLAQTDKAPTLTSIVAETFPALKRGAIADFKNIMQDSGYWDDNAWKVSDSTYEFPNGSRIEHFSADQPDRLRGSRRDRLFINEANNLSSDSFTQLEMRTKDIVWCDYNPSARFWLVDEVLESRPDECDYIILTYKGNEGLSENIVKSLESRRGKESWAKVYLDGEFGALEGTIYRDWQMIDDIPHEAKLVRYGVDFGYAEPTAIIAAYEYNGGYIVKELSYKSGMSNRQIADFIKNQEESALVICDSAEPKSIADIASYGVSAIGAKKGPDSKRNGIKYIQDLKISVTKDSLNLIKEYRNYQWKKDRDGKSIDTPEDGDDHLMDALLYGLVSLKGGANNGPVTSFGTVPSYEGPRISYSKLRY